MSQKILLILIIVLFFPLTVSAHFLETDSTVGATIHIDPNDEPIAKQPSVIYFDFKDPTGKFTPVKCDCTVSINKDEKEIYTQPLFQNSTDSSQLTTSFTYTFPELGDYDIDVHGTPKSHDDFQEFTLNYDVQVAHEPAVSAPVEQSPTSISIPVVILLLFIAGLVIFVIYKSVSSRQLPVAS